MRMSVKLREGDDVLKYIADENKKQPPHEKTQQQRREIERSKEEKKTHHYLFPSIERVAPQLAFVNF